MKPRGLKTKITVYCRWGCCWLKRDQPSRPKERSKVLKQEENDNA
jgi:hypothetical protein